ncbi:tryptophanase leader peptide [Vibrio sp. TRT 21S02]|uniref:tryptophanase leader peptide n=1 Tax=Vibrio sp. TRT 21S02 TaxID=3418507 RepID=UPI003CEC5E0D
MLPYFLSIGSQNILEFIDKVGELLKLTCAGLIIFQFQIGENMENHNNSSIWFTLDYKISFFFPVK